MHFVNKRVFITLLAVFLFSACSTETEIEASGSGTQPAPDTNPLPDTNPIYSTEGEVDQYGFTKPSAATTQANARVYEQLSFDNEKDFEDAMRGRIAHEPDLEIRDKNGNIVWKPTTYAFLQDLETGSVNPSTRRHAQLNSIHGLFEVTKGPHLRDGQYIHIYT